MIWGLGSGPKSTNPWWPWWPDGPIGHQPGGPVEPRQSEIQWNSAKVEPTQSETQCNSTKEEPKRSGETQWNSARSGTQAE